MYFDLYPFMFYDLSCDGVDPLRWKTGFLFFIYLLFIIIFFLSFPASSSTREWAALGGEMGLIGDWPLERGTTEQKVAGQAVAERCFLSLAWGAS